MPLSRKKACVHCREAKTRCNKAVPRCSRCATRRLQCEYASQSLLPNLPSGARHLALLAVESKTGPVEPSAMELGRSFGLDPDSLMQLCPPLEIPIHIDTANVGEGFSSFMAETYSQWPTIIQDPCHVEPLADMENILAKRRPMTTSGLFTTRIIMGQIESYPKMMISGHSLPPFIHSRCTWDDSSSYDCLSKPAHQCLPRTLSICQSLIQMFYNRTPTNGDFVSKTIYTEYERLANEVGVSSTYFYDP